MSSMFAVAWETYEGEKKERGFLTEDKVQAKEAVQRVMKKKNVKNAWVEERRRDKGE